MAIRWRSTPDSTPIEVPSELASPLEYTIATACDIRLKELLHLTRHTWIDIDQVAIQTATESLRTEAADISGTTLLFYAARDETIAERASKVTDITVNPVNAVGLTERRGSICSIYVGIGSCRNDELGPSDANASTATAKSTGLRRWSYFYRSAPGLQDLAVHELKHFVTFYDQDLRQVRSQYTQECVRKLRTAAAIASLSAIGTYEAVRHFRHSERPQIVALLDRLGIGLGAAIVAGKHYINNKRPEFYRNNPDEQLARQAEQIASSFPAVVTIKQADYWSM